MADGIELAQELGAHLGHRAVTVQGDVVEVAARGQVLEVAGRGQGSPVLVVVDVLTLVDGVLVDEFERFDPVRNNIVRNNMLARTTSSSASEKFVRYILNKPANVTYTVATFESTYPEASNNTEFKNPAYVSTRSRVEVPETGAEDVGFRCCQTYGE